MKIQMAFTAFEDMNVWKTAMNVATSVFEITVPLPRSEDHGLTSQIRRSALSISANIAEGFGRSFILDKIKFYIYSRGSAFETKNHLIYVKK
jgi:four helix bundle protein